MTKERIQGLIQHLLTIALVPAVIVLLGWLSVTYTKDFDWTAGGRNTLTEASQKLLASMPEEITFTAFVPADGELKRNIEADIERYRRVKNNVSLEFVDPARDPQRVRQAGITALGEVVIAYQDRTETVRALTERSITTALQRLARAGESWVLFLEGHDERPIEGDAPSALTQFVATLRERGLRVRSLNLARDATIPDNAAVIVIASPESALLEGEVRRLVDWVQGGGNLIWLADPDSPPIPALASALGVSWHGGVVVFPDFEYTSGHPGILLATDYPPNPLVQGLNAITVFPLVRSLDWDFDAGWRGMPFIQTPASAWLETGDLEGALTMDEEAGDIPGPLTVGLTLTRDHMEGEGDEAVRREQRVVLLGDADFIGNLYVNELGNNRLGLNIVQWASARDEQLDIDVPRAPDASLYVPGWAMLALGAGFVVVLPLGLLGFGVTRWALRRRH